MIITFKETVLIVVLNASDHLTRFNIRQKVISVKCKNDDFIYLEEKIFRTNLGLY